LKKEIGNNKLKISAVNASLLIQKTLGWNLP